MLGYARLGQDPAAMFIVPKSSWDTEADSSWVKLVVADTILADPLELL